MATSNRAPDNLYEWGLQRELFKPFIKTLKYQCKNQAVRPLSYLYLPCLPCLPPLCVGAVSCT